MFRQYHRSNESLNEKKKEELKRDTDTIENASNNNW